MKIITKAVLQSLLAGILLGLVLKFFIVDIVHIRGSSMEPTFKEGSAVLVNKLSYGLVQPFGNRTILRWAEPEAGDIVIFMHEGNLVIKRCVATAGSPLEYYYDNGYNLAVNGQIFPLSELQYGNMAAAGQIPDGMILAVGDNPAASIDSRDYGFIPVYNVLAKAMAPKKAGR